jgi:hypothetical protein
MEEEWELVRTSWFIRKGFLRGVVNNLRDALDEQFYSQLRQQRTVTSHPNKSSSTSTLAGAPST